MPLVTLTTKKDKSIQFIDTVLNTVHNALVVSGVPEDDKFQRVIELDAKHFKYSARYPDLPAARTDNYLLIEVLLSVGRSVKVKKQIVQQIVADIEQKLQISSEDVMVIFIETRWENWSFSGGRFIHT